MVVHSCACARLVRSLGRRSPHSILEECGFWPPEVALGHLWVPINWLRVQWQHWYPQHPPEWTVDAGLPKSWILALAPDLRLNNNPIRGVHSGLSGGHCLPDSPARLLLQRLSLKGFDCGAIRVFPVSCASFRGFLFLFSPNELLFLFSARAGTTREEESPLAGGLGVLAVGDGCW